MNKVTKFLKPEYLFLVWFLTIGLFTAIFTPPGFGYDEASHIARSQQIAEGAFLPVEIAYKDINVKGLPIGLAVGEQDSRTLFGGTSDKSLVDFAYRGSAVFFNPSNPPVHTFDMPGWDDERFASIESVGSDSITWVFSNASSNSPFVYAPYAIGLIIARLITANPWACVAIMRTFGLLASGLIIFYAIKRTMIGKWTLTAVSLFPPVTVFFGTVTADALTYATVLLLISEVSRFIGTSRQQIDWLVLAFASMGLTLSKPSYAILGLLCFALPLMSKDSFDKRDYVRWGALGIVCIIMLFTWSFIIKDIDSSVMYRSDNVVAKDQLQLVIHNPGIFIKAFFMFLSESSFGFEGQLLVTITKVPPLLLIVATVTALLIDVQQVPYTGTILRIKKRMLAGFVYIGSALLNTTLIALALYVTFTPVGAPTVMGLQERYLIEPLIVLLLGAVLLVSHADETPLMLTGRHYPTKQTEELKQAEDTSCTQQGFYFGTSLSTALVNYVVLSIPPLVSALLLIRALY